MRVNIYDVVSPVVSLKRTGKSWKGLSPFSQERTPSFFVLPEKGIYKCFSSGLAGDIFRFIEETEKLSFNEAIETIAERFNLPLEYENGQAPRPEDRSLKRELIEIHEYAADFYHQALIAKNADAQIALRYWTENRNFPLELATDFKVGFAPVSTFKLNEILVSKGFSSQALRQCGLFYARDYEPDPAKFKPRFRGRLMIPIRDHQNQVIAFTARQLELTPEDDPAREAKYINSPETPLFHKSSLVFNLERARKAVEEHGTFILVEGQLDAIRCWHEGFQATVAPQGTSITEEQMRLLKRYSPRVDVVLDGDSAGQKAALRLLPLALRAGLDLRFAHLPEGSDPDQFIASQGKEAFKVLLDRSISATEFAATALLEENPSPQQRATALNAFFEIIIEIDSETAQRAYLEEASAHFDVDLRAAHRDFERFRFINARRKGAVSRQPSTALPLIPHEQTTTTASTRLTTAERDLLLTLLQNQDLAEPLTQVVDHTWIDDTTPEGRVLARILAEITEGNWVGFTDPEIFIDSPEERNAYFNLLADERQFDEPVDVINRCLEKIHNRFLNRRLSEMDPLIQNSPPGTPEVSALWKEQFEIRRILKNGPHPALHFTTSDETT